MDSTPDFAIEYQPKWRSQYGSQLGSYEIIALLGKVSAAQQIQVVLNWFEDMKRKVPVH